MPLRVGTKVGASLAYFEAWLKLSKLINRFNSAVWPFLLW